MEGSITQRMRHIFECSKWLDIEFQLEDAYGKPLVIGAHRLILASSSPVFEALCYGPLGETKVVPVTDITLGAFQTMLQFLYTDALNIRSVDDASNLLYASKKYLLKSLFQVTSKYLCDNVSDENCFDLYNLSNICDDDRLRLVTWDYIRTHLDSAEKHVTSDNVTTDLMVQLVNETKINAKEVNIVKMAQIWAENQCRRLELVPSKSSLRNVLMQYNIFQKIQWNLLKSSDFELVCPGLFSENELLMLDLEKNSCNGIVENVRMKMPPRMVYLHRFGDEVVRRDSIRDGITVSTIVTPNKPLTLLSICCFAKCSPLKFHLSNINQVHHYVEQLVFSIVDEEGHLIHEPHSFRKEIEYDKPFKIKLLMPLLLESSRSYDIRVCPYHSLGDYQCVIRNNFAKVPSGYLVRFSDRADVFVSGQYVNSPNLSFVSGLECSS